MELRKTSRNISIVALSYALMWIATFVFTLAQARYLEPARFGQLSLALSYTTFLSIAIDFGLGTQLSRMVAQGVAGKAEALAATIAIRGVLWILAMPVLWLVTSALGYGTELQGAILILALSALVISVSTTIAAYLQGHEEFLLPSIASVLYRVSAAAIGTMVLHVHPDLGALAAVYVAAAMVNVAVLVFGLRRHRVLLGFDARGAVALFRSSIPIGAYFIVASFYFNVDMVMLEQLAPAESVGWYAAAYRLFIAATILPQIVNGMVLYPVFSRLSLGSRDQLKAVIDKALTFLTLAGMAAALVLALSADRIVALLYPADAYGEAANALRLLAPGIPLLYLNSVFSYVLFALKDERRLLVMAIAFAILNPLGNLVAITLLEHEGAALMTTLTEFGILLWLLRLMPSDLLGRESFRVVAKASLAAIAAALVFVLAREHEVPATLLLALLVYGGAALALRAVAPADLRAVLALVRVERR